MAVLMLTIGVSQNSSPKIGTLSLSRGKVFEWVYRVPYVLPPGCYSQITITDASGLILAAFDGVVDERTITFLESPDVTDVIPHGVNFDFSITYPEIGEPAAIGYGTVVRKEPRFTLLPPLDVTQTAVQFSDDFSAVVDRRWITMGGVSPLVIHSNGSLPSTMGPNYGFTASAVAKWAPPMNMDSVTVVVNLVHLGFDAGTGWCTVIVCADYAMSRFMAIQFQAGLSGNGVRAMTSSNGEWDYQTPLVGNVVSNESYTIKYSHVANVLAVYKGAALTPLLSWEDVGHLVPHGSAAYRYTGLAFSTSIAAPSIEPTAWEAKDGT